MSESQNPYQSAVSADGGPATRQRIPTLLTAALPWVVLGVLLAIGRLILLPIYADFDATLPQITVALLSLFAPLPFFLLAGVSLVVVIAMPSERTKRWAALLSLLLGLLVGLFCAYAVLLPLTATTAHIR